MLTRSFASTVMLASLSACATSAPPSRGESAAAVVFVAEATPGPAASPTAPVSAPVVEEEAEPEATPVSSVTDEGLRAIAERSAWRERLGWTTECEGLDFERS
jgi:hypothetical protein